MSKSPPPPSDGVSKLAANWICWGRRALPAFLELPASSLPSASAPWVQPAGIRHRLLRRRELPLFDPRRATAKSWAAPPGDEAGFDVKQPCLKQLLVAPVESAPLPPPCTRSSWLPFSFSTRSVHRIAQEALWWRQEQHGRLKERLWNFFLFPLLVWDMSCSAGLQRKKQSREIVK